MSAPKFINFLVLFFPCIANGRGNYVIPADEFLPQLLHSISGLMMVGEHHSRMSNSFAISDINRRLVSLLGSQAIETIDLKVSVHDVSFHPQNLDEFL